uniref:Uncharacterized protein n=1 Tax=Anguilla anguilla TaxID=7936 RepID=A0A0E9T009_ANGAN
MKNKAFQRTYRECPLTINKTINALHYCLKNIL